MKFAKKYATYMKGMEAELPAVGLKRLKKMLKKCRSHDGAAAGSPAAADRCPGHCSVCDGSFFPSLLNEMSAVVGCFNAKAKKLLELHLASGFKKYAMWFTSKGDESHGKLIQQGKDLVTYAIINAVAMRKILKKYDKDTVFDPVSLSCGHIFCYLCCCSAASVTIVDGLKSANHKSKCPLCRQQGVFPDAVHLDELNMLLSHSCPEYWEKRTQSERVERVRLAKEHWESQCRAFLGI
ncbi:probable E3 ubiquitin-protein ligase BAH1-like 1 isoform X2 [Setaria viridis]|uniref:probable E3 ubiquitin-protein ligase BAH1-like 1 isoform X2 n=1 Tax=Setaria viridis TaxID=4556 RepID=UPI003B3A881F